MWLSVTHYRFNTLLSTANTPHCTLTPQWCRTLYLPQNPPPSVLAHFPLWHQNPTTSSTNRVMLIFLYANWPSDTCLTDLWFRVLRMSMGPAVWQRMGLLHIRKIMFKCTISNGQTAVWRNSSQPWKSCLELDNTVCSDQCEKDTRISQ